MVTRANPILGLFLTVLTVSGCATAPPQLPYGGDDASQSRWPGPPRQEPLKSDTFGQAFVDAMRSCEPQGVTARVHIRGTLERRRIDTSLWVGVDVATPRLRLESVDAGSRSFSLLAGYSYPFDGKDEATLLLPAKQWVVRSRSRQIVELVLGVPLSGLDLQSVLTGCPILPGGTLRHVVFNDRTIKMVVGDDTLLELFMRRRNAASPWTVFATVAGVPGRPIRWRADPGRRSGGVLESVRLTSVEWNGTAGRLFDLTFSFDRTRAPAIAPDMFTLRIPDSAGELELEAMALNVSVPLLAD